MNIVDRLREQAAADEKAGTLYSHELLKQAAYLIERLTPLAARYIWMRDIGDETFEPFKERYGYHAGNFEAYIDAALKKDAEK